MAISTAEAQLNTALVAIAQPPPAKPEAPLPEIARTISGKTFVFESNPIQPKTLQLSFDDSAVANMQLTFADAEPPRRGAIGLDGVYRRSAGPNSLLVGALGSWMSDQPFGSNITKLRT